MKICFLFILLTLSLNGFTQVNPNPCLYFDAYRIVILGSSTAAGAGANPRDSAWVNRYRSYLQNINPNNEVINLGVGGFVTYRIMPTGFVPPANRPLPDTTKNISAALALNPDAIIVNLPSNDRQFPMAEQLNNFDSLFRHSNRHNVPIFICTTQPIQSSGTYQAQVKDSILARFGGFSIDFWTTLAMPNNEIFSIYAADAVHLNNLGHRILFQKAIQKNIFDSIPKNKTHVDFTSFSLNELNPSICGDSTTELQLIVANLGKTENSIIATTLEILNKKTNQQIIYRDTISNGLYICEADTFIYQVNTFDGGDFEFTAYLSNPIDTILENDTIRKEIFYLGNPVIQKVKNDTIKPFERAKLAVQASDSVFWYENQMDQNSIFQGDTFTTPILQQSKTYFVSSIRKEITSDSLLNSNQSDVTFNGIMFDVIAKKDLVLDSLACKINASGNYVLWKRNGSHRGFEMDSSKWQLLAAQFMIKIPGEPLSKLKIPQQKINAGDTLGFYFHAYFSNLNINYQRITNPNIVENQDISIYSGTGKSFNFGNSYFPRNWNGKVFYHYKLQCESDRKMVEAVVIPLSLEKENLLQIQVYPNPFQNKIRIELNDFNATNIKILDVLGRELMSFNNPKQSFELDTSYLSRGMYFLIADNKSKKFIRKIVKF